MHINWTLEVKKYMFFFEDDLNFMYIAYDS